MTSQEFNDQFDLLWNNIASNQAPGLDEYEKSVFLTKAQNEILLSYFDSSLNKSRDGFDDSPKRQADFSNVLVSGSVKFESATGTYFHKNTEVDNIFSTRAGSYDISSLPDLDDDVKILMMIEEMVVVTRNSNTVYLSVVPISYNNLQRMYSKPFKRPTKYQAWRVFTNKSSSFAKILVGPSDTPQYYYYKFIRKPYPIILSTLSSETIEGYTDTYEDFADTDQGCMLDPILHEDILQRAIELAKGSWEGNLSTQVALGTQSETNMGILNNR